MFQVLAESAVSPDVFSTLDHFLLWIKHLMTLFGALVIFIGALFVICQFLYRLMRHKGHEILDFDLVRLGLTRSIALGLEFIIAADVIGTTTTPDYYELGILASIVAIRAFLNYFLNRDLDVLNKRERQAQHQK